MPLYTSFPTIVTFVGKRLRPCKSSNSLFVHGINHVATHSEGLCAAEESALINQTFNFIKTDNDVKDQYFRNFITELSGNYAYRRTTAKFFMDNYNMVRFVRYKEGELTSQPTYTQISTRFSDNTQMPGLISVRIYRTEAITNSHMIARAHFRVCQA